MMRCFCMLTNCHGAVIKNIIGTGPIKDAYILSPENCNNVFETSKIHCEWS